MDNNFFHKNNNNWGIKGLGDNSHLTHNIGSNEFHITTPIKIEGVGTLKIRDNFDTLGTFKTRRLGFTDKE